MGGALRAFTASAREDGRKRPYVFAGYGDTHHISPIPARAMGIASLHPSYEGRTREYRGISPKVITSGFSARISMR
jgi:hypothetical protein